MRSDRSVSSCVHLGEAVPYPAKDALFKPLGFLQKVKYRGAVGKQTAITVVVLIVLGIALLSVWGQTEAVYFIVATVVFVFLSALFAIHKTLAKHPELALLDGLELVEYKKLDIAAKNMRRIPDTIDAADPQPALLEAADDSEETEH